MCRIEAPAALFCIWLAAHTKGNIFMRIAITVQLEPPTLQDNTADADRLKAELKNHLKPDRVDIDFNLLKILPELRLPSCVLMVVPVGANVLAIAK